MATSSIKNKIEIFILSLLVIVLVLKLFGVELQILSNTPPEAKKLITKLKYWRDDKRMNNRLEKIRMLGQNTLASRYSSSISPILIDMLKDISNPREEPCIDKLWYKGNLREYLSDFYDCYISNSDKNPYLFNQTISFAAAEALNYIADPDNIEPLKKLLKHKNDIVRAHAARAMRYDMRVAEYIIPLTYDSSVYVRKNAVEALEISCNPLIIEPLINSLSDSDKDVRSKALLGLERIFTILDSPLIVDTLIKVLSTGTYGEKSGAIKLLGGSHDTRVVEPLISALKDKHVIQACEALGNTKDPRAIEPLIEILRTSSDIRFQKAAIAALSNFKEPRVTDILLETLKDVSLQEDILNALKSIKDPRVIKPLFEIVNDKSSRNRFVARRTLFAIDDPGIEKGLKAIMDKVENGKEELHAWSQAHILGELSKRGDKTALEKLIKLFKSETQFFRYDSMGVFADLKVLEVVEPLIDLLTDPDYGIGAAQALGSIGDKRAIEPLRKALVSDDSHVRFHAGVALGKLGDKKTLNELISIINGGEGFVERREAAKILADIGSPETYEQLLTIFNDKDNPYRRQALMALCGLKAQKVTELVISALDDENYDVRSVAIIALNDINSPRGIELLTNAMDTNDVIIRFSIARALVKFSGEKLGADKKKWLAWWEKNKDKYISVKPE